VVRYGNEKRRSTATAARWRPGRLPVATHETLTARQRLAERLFLGLRTADGVPEAWLDERVDLEPERLAALRASGGASAASWRHATGARGSPRTDSSFPTPSSSTSFSVE
jgi:coproporphyrinogen III oxidase-like Fe-S oxidoreductase